MAHKSIKVLLIEDNRGDARLIEELLAEAVAAFKLVLADQLSSGLAYLGSGTIDVLLLDLNLPDSHGLDTFTTLHAHAPQVPVVVLSGLDDEALAAKAVHAGAQDYLVKGRVDSNLLARTIRYAIERQRIMEDLRGHARKLEASEARFCKIIEENTDGIIIVDRYHRIRFVNPVAEALINCKDQDIIGEQFRLPLMTGETTEIDFVDSKGESGVAEVRAVEIEWDGNPAYLVSLHDIRQRKRAEEALRQSEARFRDLVEGSLQGIFIHHKFKPLFVNRAFAEILGYDSPQELLARLESIELHHAPHERARLRAYKDARLQGGKAPAQYEYEALRKDGTIITLQNSVRVITWNGRRAIQSTVIDVTTRKRAEQALRASEERFRALYDDNPCMYFTINLDGTVLSVNPFGAQQLGYTNGDLIGTSIFDLFHNEDRETAQRLLDDVMREPERLHRWKIRKVGKDGNLLWVRETARATESTDGQRVILMVCEDITEAHELSEELSYQASHDVLTGLYNRHEFERRLQRMLDSARTAKTEHVLCYLDLDQFKVINDICGHIAGDELLRQLGRVLKAKVRQRDTLARLGGDEFGVLMEHCSLKNAKRTADALRAAIQNFQFLWEGKSFRIGVSIGVVPITGASKSLTTLLSTADAACYMAKDEGRNRIHVYHEDDTETERRLNEMQRVAQINEALEQDRFHLVFQPIAALQNCEGEHYELLIRMEDEAGQMVPPGAFLPAAERYNLSSKLDRWVITEAFGWLAGHPEHLKGLYLCSINLSGHSLGDEEFLRFVTNKFSKGRVPAEKICFEITETAAIANLAGATRFIEALKKLGCRFALDDFGTGLSSFAYLKNLPVDLLKIDGMFVKDIVEDPIALAMVKSINEIGHVMGKRTIAEFVENEAILAKLREIGVDYAQGYGIGRPQPLAQMLLSRTANLNQ